MVLGAVEIVVEEEPEGEMAMCAEGDGATRAGGEPVGSRLGEALDAEAAIVDLSCHEMAAQQQSGGERIGEVRACSDGVIVEIAILRRVIAGHETGVGQQEAATYAEIGIEEPCGLCADGIACGGVIGSPILHPIVREWQAESDVDTGKGRAVVAVEKISVRMPGKAPVLEDEVGKIISHLCADDADAGSRDDIAEPMLVVGHAHNGSTCRHGVCSDAHPRAEMSVLLIEHGGRHESRCRMTGGKALTVGSVGACPVNDVLHGENRCAHDGC